MIEGIIFENWEYWISYLGKISSLLTRVVLWSFNLNLGVGSFDVTADLSFKDVVTFPPTFRNQIWLKSDILKTQDTSRDARQLWKYFRKKSTTCLKETPVHIFSPLLRYVEKNSNSHLSTLGRSCSDSDYFPSASCDLKN